MEYKVIRSRRKTMAIEIRGGKLIVRVPVGTADSTVRSFVDSHRDWIGKHLAEAERKEAEAKSLGKLSQAEIREIAERAAQVIPERVQYYAAKAGVSYGRITIRLQKTRWGSCTAAGNLNFNCLLMLAPTEVLDSVIVHELCHRKEMNHSKAFYAEVLRVYPDYRKWNRWLKENGSTLMKMAGLQ